MGAGEVVCCAVAAVLIGVPYLVFTGMHQVPQGYVGIYYRDGILLNEISQAGVNFMNPLFTKYDPVQVTIQIDEVRDIPCGTKEGVLITVRKF